MAPISRREQHELDELLGDIYRGIETLPDNSTYNSNDPSSSTREYQIEDTRSGRTLGRAYVREYELDESSPLVRRHKQELAASRRFQQQQQASGEYYEDEEIDDDASNNSSRRQRSSLKRQNNQAAKRVGTTPDATTTAEAQSLASFVKSNPVSKARATPEHKRRVRIVDHRETPTDYQGSERAEANNYNYKPYSNDRSNNPEAENENDDEADYPGEDTYIGSEFDSRQKVYSPNAGKKQKVKYVNTNKLIYHQELEPEEESDENGAENRRPQRRAHLQRGKEAEAEELGEDDEEEEEDEFPDGATRVEYYHTTWLDRQLGRATKRRSSKELNERQVKEKAMIEELKRSLKNGAITLKQSFKGNKNHQKNNKRQQNPEDPFDEGVAIEPKQQQQQHRARNHLMKDEYFAHRNTSNNKSIFSSGLATVPRNYNSSGSSRSPQSKINKNIKNKQSSGGVYHIEPESRVSGPYTSRQLFEADQPAKQQKPNNNNNNKQQQQVSPSHNSMHQQYNSLTLPHKRSSPQHQEHQLLQSHYRGGTRHITGQPKTTTTTTTTTTTATPTSATTLTAPQFIHHQHQSITTTTQQQTKLNDQQAGDKMRNPLYTSSSNSSTLWCPTQNNDNIINQQQAQTVPQAPLSRGVSGTKSPMQQQASSTLNRMPSATEVVRSALSRSSSQTSLNQLNKTINLLPNSPPPATPTHQSLKATSPPLSPSPVGWQQHLDKQNQSLYPSKTLGHPHQHQHQHPTIQTTTGSGQIVVQGTRTIGRPPQVTTQTQQQQQKQQQPLQQQPAYSNPHTSLMQHRQEQQMKQPNRNSASIREFNELDSLLRSLSGAATSGGSSYQPRSQIASTNVSQSVLRTPAQVSESAATQITPGFSSRPVQPSFGGFMSQQQQQPITQQQTQIKPTNEIYAKVQKPVHQINQTTHQPYIIDVTENKSSTDENCRQQYQQQSRIRQHEQLSEFEPSTELLPSMEDYQNISKLNPVTNRYWYKPNMSREHAISLLKDKPQGTFIVRDSTSFKGAYGLAVKVSKLPKNVLENAHLRTYNDPSAEYIRHFLIEPVGNGGVRLKGYANEPVFDNLADLIYQHSLTELALPCKLVIPRADIEDPRFNQKQKQFYDEFLASKEQAKHTPYERTSPNGGYRRYPGDVLVHNEHRIIFE